MSACVTRCLARPFGVLWGVAFATSALVAPSAGAQTLFVSPHAGPDYASYRNAEDCIAAMRRLVEQDDAHHVIERDTAPPGTASAHPPFPPAAVEAGARCLRNVSVDTLPLGAAQAWAVALWTVGRDADAEKIYQRAIDAPGDDRLFRVMDMLDAYRYMRVVRSDVVRSLYQRALRLIPADSLFQTLAVKGTVLLMAREAGDTGFVRTLTRELLTGVAALPAQVKANPYYATKIGMPLYETLLALSAQEERDSLAVSSLAFRAYLERQWGRVFSMPFSAAKNPIGLQAPPLAGDFWFRSTVMRGAAAPGGMPYEKSVPEVRPVAGRINVIAFLQSGCHPSTPVLIYGRENGRLSCESVFASLRRLKGAYPEVEITIVTKTFGNVGDAPPQEPADEAELLAKYFLGFHRIPAVHVISNTDYFRIGGLDRRRIDSESPNEIAYTIADGHFGRPGTVVAVDEGGRIFYAGMSQSSDANFERILLARVAAVSRRAGGGHTIQAQGAAH